MCGGECTESREAKRAAVPSASGNLDASPGDSFFATFNLRSLGVALSMSWIAAMLLSPAAVSPYYLDGGFDGRMQLLRLVFLFAVCLVYTATRVRPALVFGIVLQRGALVGGLLLSALPLLGVVEPGVFDAISGYRALDLLFWGCGGVSGSAMMLVWGFGMETKRTYGQGVVNVAAGTAFSGAFFALFSFLQYPVAAILLLCVPFVLLALQTVCARSTRAERAGDACRYNAGQTNVATSIRVVLGNNASLFVFSSGFLAGLSGSIGTRFSLVEYAPLFVGAAFVLAGVLMLVCARTGRLKIGTWTFALFLPFASACLFGFSVSSEAATVALLFAVFAVGGAYNVLNTAYFDKGSLPVVAASSCSTLVDACEAFAGESRSAVAAGAACGWAGGMIIWFYSGSQETSYGYFLAAIVLTAMAAAASARENARVGAYDSGSPASLAKVWDESCRRLAQAHGLTAREREIFLMLSRGRDRQYIHDALRISPNTVRTHAYNLYRKLGVHNQQQLIDLVESELSDL